jgi:rubrerythrin
MAKIMKKKEDLETVDIGEEYQCPECNETFYKKKAPKACPECGIAFEE